MTFTYEDNLPSSFDEFICVSEQTEKKIRDHLYNLAETECWYNEYGKNPRQYFVMDYLKLVYERAAEQYNETEPSKRYRYVSFSKSGTNLIYHSGLFSREGQSLYVSVNYDEGNAVWNLKNIMTEIDTDYYYYGQLPDPIDFDDFNKQFYQSYPIDDSYLTEPVLSMMEDEMIDVIGTLKISRTVWETAKVQLKRDHSRAIPVYRAGVMRFLVPLLYRKSDYVDMCVELTINDTNDGYEVTGYHNASESYTLARRMGPVRNYWLIKRSGNGVFAT